MPFTPAHVAAVLPVLRIRSLSATALVFGSMAPDFEYFITFSSEAHFAHTLKGLFLFDLPAVLVLSLVFHTIVKQSLIQNLPGFLRERFQDTLSVEYVSYLKRHPVAFASAALLGAASHIAWDSFTHADGFFVRELQVYEGAVVPFHGAKYPLFYALQHISTYTGLAAVVLYVLLRRRTAVFPARATLGYWAILLFTMLATVTIRFAIDASDYSIGNAVVCIISGMCIGCVVAGLLHFRSVTAS